jgi:hypothetical protein
LHCDEGDEPARHAMIDLHGGPQSLGAAGCCRPGLDRCDELRPEILFLRSVSAPAGRAVAARLVASQKLCKVQSCRAAPPCRGGMSSG